MKLESIICPNCLRNKTKKYITTKNFRVYSQNNSYCYYKCYECKLVFLKEDNSNKLNLYSDDYHCYSGLRKRNYFFNKIASLGFNNRIKIINQYKISGNLLDIGCATGEFLKSMNERGSWNLFGVEPNDSARSSIKKLNNIKVFTNLFDANFPNQFFDVITLWDVVEHIDEPLILFKEIERIIKIGGLLVIKTPDPNSKEAKLFGSCWSGLEAPWHLFLFPKVTIQQILTQYFFSTINYHEPNLDYHTFYRSINNILLSNNRFTLNKCFSFLYKNYPFKLFFNLLLRILRFFKFNSAITISAIKINKEQ